MIYPVRYLCLIVLSLSLSLFSLVPCLFALSLLVLILPRIFTGGHTPKTTMSTNTPLMLTTPATTAVEFPHTSFGVDIHIIIINTIHSVSINYYCYLLYLFMLSRYHSLGIASAKDATRKRGAMAGFRSTSYRGIGEVFVCLFDLFIFYSFSFCFSTLCYVYMYVVLCYVLLFVLCFYLSLAFILAYVAHRVR